MKKIVKINSFKINIVMNKFQNKKVDSRDLSDNVVLFQLRNDHFCTFCAVKTVRFIPSDVQLIAENLFQLRLCDFALSEEHYSQQHHRDVIDRGEFVGAFFLRLKNFILDKIDHFELIGRKNQLQTGREMN
jgi:uncharacterized protein YfkK (UPF0435 family)